MLVADYVSKVDYDTVEDSGPWHLARAKIISVQVIIAVVQNVR